MTNSNKKNNLETDSNITPEMLEQAVQLRTQVRESFAKVTMMMMNLPRYRHASLTDLNHLILEPLLRNRIALAYPKTDSVLADTTGIAIWASVSEAVDKKIREQIKAGTFPIRLKAEEWDSGNINWLFDVMASDKESTALVIRNLKQVIKEGDLNMHPLVAKLVDQSLLEAMGAKPMASETVTQED